jgi:hypothetical protein
MKMTWTAAMVAGMLGVTVGMAQVAIEPPPAGQSNNTNSIAPPQTPQTPSTPSTPPSAQHPSGAAAATVPSAASVLQGLLNDRQPSEQRINGTQPAGTNVVQQRDAVAPNEPAATRLAEGQTIYRRVGRLVKDDKTGSSLFVFDSDGKEMHDPPMGLVPCRLLAMMEDMSEYGAKAVKFRLSGEVTQYRGKNFVFPRNVSVVRDLNQGLGG